MTGPLVPLNLPHARNFPDSPNTSQQVSGAFVDLNEPGRARRERIVAPVVPGGGDRDRARPETAVLRAAPRRVLPLSILAALPDDGSLVHGMGRLDASGRITDRTVLSALGWRAGHRFAAAPAADSLVVCPDPLGTVSITGAGFLAIPAAQRRWCASSAKRASPGAVRLPTSRFPRR